MTKHKHAGMIKAKADNMSLVVFVETSRGWNEQVIDDGDIRFLGTHCYFVCHPNHKDLCQQWLNKEIDLQFKDTQDIWCEVLESPWCFASIWMNPKKEFRIKPRKEKRWIAYVNGTNCAYVYEDYEIVKPMLDNPNVQIIEIEVII